MLRARSLCRSLMERTDLALANLNDNHNDNHNYNEGLNTGEERYYNDARNNGLKKRKD